MRPGPLWSHLLASVLGGVVVAGALLAFGVIGRPTTETVPIDTSAPPSASAGTAGPDPGAAGGLYLHESPGVVTVRTTVARRIPSPFTAAPERPGARVSGSGFLISRSGYLLTAFHVIAGAVSGPPEPIEVQLDAGTVRPAAVIEADSADDVALLKVDMKGVPVQVQPLPLGNSRSVTVGESVYAMADPDGQRTVSSGIVAALVPELSGVDGSIDGVMQTDLVPDPGAAGGPLLDSAGDVVGVDSEIEVDDGGSVTATAFAVPIDTARTIVPAGVLR